MHMFTSLSLTWNRSLPQTMKTVDIKKLREGAEGFSHQELHIWPWIFIGRTDAEAEAPILWPPGAKSQLTGKDLDAGKDWGQKEKGEIEDEVVGWHHQFNGHEFMQAPGDSEGQGSLACCSPWDHKESDTTEWLNWELIIWFSTGRVWRCRYQSVCKFLFNKSKIIESISTHTQIK